MASTKDTFKYSSDPLGEDELRVIDIQPDHEEDIVHCKLITIKRDSKEPYRALSYAWGDPAKTYNILLNGQDFCIHKNLHEALLHVRNKQQTVRLWTDAICNDQGNIPERNAQVRQMGETYVGAEEVLIWLGNAPASSHSLSDVCSLAERKKPLTTADTLVYEAAMNHVFGREWFQRLWVFQEAALARKATVMLGQQHCELEDLVRSKNVRPPEGSEPSTLVPSMLNLEFIARFRYNRLGQNPDLSQGDIISMCRGLRCTDARDCVFGTTGLAQRQGIPHEEVDYGLSVAEVYQSAMTHELGKHFNSLISSHQADDTVSALNLPSWVPNFSQRLPAVILMADFYNAGGRSVTEACQNFKGSILSKAGLLILPGITFDIVHWSPADGKTSGPYGDYTANLQAFWRTLVANRQSSFFSEKEYSHQDNGAEYEVFLGRAMPFALQHGDSRSTEQASKEVALKFTRDFQRSLWVLEDRRLFVTKEGYFGLGPEGIQRRDQVVVVPGLMVPLVLRKQPTRDKYQFIGPAYVHGIMHHNCVERLKESGRESRPDIFVIE